MTRSWVVASLALLACKPEPGSDEPVVSSEPTLIVERQGEGPACELVTRDDDVALEIREHDDWLDLWLDRELDSEGDSPPTSAIVARRHACATTEDATARSLRCTDSGLQVLAIPIGYELAILVVEEHEHGLRSVELSRWMNLCRCECGSRVEVLGRDPLRVVVSEYESMASEVHAEEDAIVEGCDEDDECSTACLGDIYGNQRLLVFGDSLGLPEVFVDDSVREGGQFEVRFALDQGRLIATGECTQVLAD